MSSICEFQDECIHSVHECVVRKHVGTTVDNAVLLFRFFDTCFSSHHSSFVRSFVSATNLWLRYLHWQEYNPGGGKDEVLKYLEESRKQVVLAKQALGTILSCLEDAST